MEIPKEYREAYRKVIWTRSGLERDLQLALRWAVAEALKVEFDRDHIIELGADNFSRVCDQCGMEIEFVDEHSWSDDNWRQAAERKLAEE